MSTILILWRESNTTTRTTHRLWCRIYSLKRFGLTLTCPCNSTALRVTLVHLFFISVHDRGSSIIILLTYNVFRTIILPLVWIRSSLKSLGRTHGSFPILIRVVSTSIIVSIFRSKWLLLSLLTFLKISNLILLILNLTSIIFDLRFIPIKLLLFLMSFFLDYNTSILMFLIKSDQLPLIAFNSCLESVAISFGFTSHLPDFLGFLNLFQESWLDHQRLGI